MIRSLTFRLWKKEQIQRGVSTFATTQVTGLNPPGLLTGVSSLGFCGMKIQKKLKKSKHGN